MSLRAELIELVDDVRHTVVDEAAGLRLFDVVVRVVTWAGGAPGRGAASARDLALHPRPKVRPANRFRLGEAGRVQEGELEVSRISATYTEAELTGAPLGADQELLWLIDGKPYRPTGPPELRTLEWRQGLRPTLLRPGA